jgi:hypothetical protein
MSIDAILAAPAMRGGEPIFGKMQEWASPGFRCGLSRWWGSAEAADTQLCPLMLPWIMLNPSTADGSTNNPTLRRIIHFSWMWGFDGLVVFHVYPWRTPSSRALAKLVVGWSDREDWNVRDEIWANHAYIAKQIAVHDAAMVAWGCPPRAIGVDTEHWIESLFDKINDDVGPRDYTLKLWCLGRTKDGSPIHPMARGKHRVADGARPVPFKNPGTIELLGKVDAAVSP